MKMEAWSHMTSCREQECQQISEISAPRTSIWTLFSPPPNGQTERSHSTTDETEEKLLGECCERLVRSMLNIISIPRLLEEPARNASNYVSSHTAVLPTAPSTLPRISYGATNLTTRQTSTTARPGSLHAPTLSDSISQTPLHQGMLPYQVNLPRPLTGEEWMSSELRDKLEDLARAQLSRESK